MLTKRNNVNKKLLTQILAKGNLKALSTKYWSNPLDGDIFSGNVFIDVKLIFVTPNYFNTMNEINTTGFLLIDNIGY